MADNNDNNRQDEYNGLCAERDSYQSQADAKQAYINDLKEKLARLDDAYDKVKALKEAFKDHKNDQIKKSYEKYNKGDLVWVGTTYNELESGVKDVMLPDYTTFINNVDTVLDDIGTLRTEYENKIYEENGLLGTIMAKLNSLWSRIRNFWN